MTFRVACQANLPASCSPYRIVDERGIEIAWANRFLDMQCARGLRPLTLRTNAHILLHFVRWWSRQPRADMHHLALDQFTQATLVDYVQDQVNEIPKPSPETINSRSSTLRSLFRFTFDTGMPQGPYRIQRVWNTRTSLGYGRRCKMGAADLKVKVARRVVVPLSREQVERFWHSFQKTRDLAMVALMLLNGLRSREVLGLQLQDLLFSEAQVHVRGKGGRVRRLPMPPETIRLLQCYLKNERPLTNTPEVFVALKGRARGTALKPAGLRSLFRHHRKTSGIQPANPHRFRHTFGSDMVRAGVSLPALQRLMGHAHIQTTLVYIYLTPQDVFAEYARAVEKMTLREQPPGS